MEIEVFFIGRMNHLNQGSAIQSNSLFHIGLKMSSAMSKQLERLLQLDFLWQGLERTKNYHFVDRAIVCKPKDERCLGIRPSWQVAIEVRC